MAMSLQIHNAVTAQELMRRGGQWSPHVNWIVPTQDEIETEFVQSLLDKYASDVEAYSIAPVFDCETFCVELQFRDSAVGDRCRAEYRRGFGKGGVVPKKKQAKPKKARKRLYTRRMYRLPDGEWFFYYAKWDRHGNVVGKVEDEVEGQVRNKVIHRSVLEEATLVPKGEEPWVLG